MTENSVFKLWHDPWLIQKPLVERFGEGFISIMDSTSSASVGSIILNRQWAVVGSNDYRAIQFRHLLSSFLIGNKDLVLWNGNDTVNISVIWDSFRRRGGVCNWLPLIWNIFYIPACSFITWLACRNRLLTKDKMVLFHMDVNRRCVLCRSYDEDVEHLFTICPYAYIVMRECPFDLVISWNRWIQGDFFNDRCTSLQKNIAFLYVTVAIYLIWKERNCRIHNQGDMPVGQLIILVKRMVREKLFSCTEFRRHLIRDPTYSQFLY